MSDLFGIVLATADGLVQVVPGEDPRPVGDGAPTGAPVANLDLRDGVLLAAVPGHGVWAHRSGGGPATGWAQVWEGDARSVRISPDGPWYIGVAPAALHLSTDEGETWAPMENMGNVLRHYRSRASASGGDYPVTGVVFPATSMVVTVEGLGAWASRDGGRTWMPRAEGLDPAVQHVWDHPDRGDRLYATARSGFYRSEDAGFSWIQSLSGLDRSYGGQVAVLPDTPDVLLLSAARRDTPPGTGNEPPPADNAALFRSENGGIAWRRLLLGDEDAWPVPPAVGALPGSDDTCFVAAGARLWGSHDRGKQWLPIAEGLPLASSLVVAL